MPSVMWAKFGGEGKPLAYVCGKLEQSKTKGPAGLHIQGWAQFCKRIRLTAILKMFPSQCHHWEPCAGTEEQNEKYCRKTATQIGEFESFGMFQKQGAANVKAIDNIETMVRRGDSIGEIWRNTDAGVFACMSTRYRGIKEAISYMHDEHKETAEFREDQFAWSKVKWGLQDDGDDQSLTWVIAGPAGAGKTEYGLMHFDNCCMIKTQDDVGRYDPKDHDGMLFDDCDAWIQKLSRTEQVQLLEQKRGSTFRIRYTNVFIPGGTRKLFTTNDPTGEIFNPHASCTRRYRIKIVAAVQHPAGAAVVPDVQASSSSREPGNLSQDGLDDEEPGVLVRANAAFVFDVPAAEELEGWSQLSSQ